MEEDIFTHVSLFALEAGSRRPFARLPFYAEISVRIDENPDPEEISVALSEESEAILREIDGECFDNGECRGRTQEALRIGFARSFSKPILDLIFGEHDRASEFLTAVLKRGHDLNGGGTFLGIDNGRLNGIIKAAIRSEAQNHGLDLKPESELSDNRWALPLGVLATDHVGYLSYDLTRFPREVGRAVGRAVRQLRENPGTEPEVRVWLYPLGSGLSPFEMLSQRRSAPGVILAEVELAPAQVPQIYRDFGLLSMQNPSLVDWRLSPSSFARNPGTLIGADGCQTILPANIGLQQFRFFQAIRLGDPALIPLPEQFGDQVRLGFVQEYRQTWYPLGHSLGQVLYSLPLAPGESVNLAVIDWIRQDSAGRTEDSKLDEQLVHNQRRERTITETVNAAIKEYQNGSSLMGGGALSAGLAGSTGAMGAAIGSAFSLGGASSSSEGSRDLVASTTQNISDNVSQASAAMREFQSTVVVQSVQSEKQAIETRTVVNYNHSHTLTVLYYEVLRHFRVATTQGALQPAVFVRMPPITQGAFTAAKILGWRYLLEPGLLDPTLAIAFDGISRIALGEEKLKRDTNKWLGTTQTIDPGAKSFVKLIAQFTTTDDDTSEPVFVALTLQDGRSFEFQCDDAGSEGTSREYEHPLPIAINWNQIKGVEIKLKDINSGGAWEVTNILVTMVTLTGERVGILADANTRTLEDDESTGLLPTIQPPPATTTTTGPKPQRTDYVTAEDELAVQTLISHLEANRGYYLRLIGMGQNRIDQARQLDSMKVSPDSSLLDFVDPRALEVYGDYLVFRCTNGDWARQVRRAVVDLERQPDLDERLITIPTRGVFAEAKLGNCNVSEEIDNTRFWDWQSSPIPHMAPEITPVQPITPQPQQPQGLGPTPFPASLVNIVNPPAAPDPTGLGPALSAITTPNIFRDMSGRAEVADLLKRLSDNSISIAEAANRAQGIRSKYGDTSAGPGFPGLGPAPAMGGQRATPSQPSAVNRDLHDRLNLLDSAVNKGLMSPDSAADAMQSALFDASPSLQQAGNKYVRPAYTPNELAGIIGETVAEDALRAQGHIVFSDWRKHVSGTGFDMVSFNPAGQGELWIVDNKAQFRGISNANALTGDAFSRYSNELKSFLAKTWPSKAEADLALHALEQGRVKLVVTNGFAGEAARFTKGLFDKGLHAFDVRLSKLFSSHAEWEVAYKALSLRKAARLTGRSMACHEGLLLVLATVGGVGYLLKSGSTFKAIAGELAANVALDVILSRLPGGFFASLVIGLESDESPGQRAERKLSEQIDTILSALPNVQAMSPGDLKATKETLRSMIQNPIVIEVEPEPAKPGINLPGFHYSAHPDWA